MPQRQSPFSLRRFLEACCCVASLILATFSPAAAQTETVLHSFNVVPNGDTPYWRLVADASGNFYGTTNSGGTYRSGTAFRLSPQATGGFALTVIYNFGADGGGFSPGPLAIDSAGNLYGTLSTATGGSVFKLTNSVGGTWNAVNISTFASNAGPSGQLTFDHAGNLYGVSVGGGVSNWGAVYELTPTAQGQWLETTLHSFTNGADGGIPNGGVAFDASGNLYGTTSSGGDPGCNPWDQRNPTCGVVFKLTNTGGVWSETTLLSFDFNNGAYPRGGPVFDAAGNLYGSTFEGPGFNCVQGCGTIFRLSPNSDGTWTQSLIYTFPGGPSGSYPNGNLVFDSHGNIYGTTAGGGSTACGGLGGCGTIFELSPTSGAYWAEKVIYQFARNGTIGSGPADGVIFDSAGNLYGTASTSDGPYCCVGTIYELSPSSGGKWTASSLYTYSSGNDGLYPATALVADAYGNLYGVTNLGGNYAGCDCGAVFEMSPTAGGGWSESVIYDYTQGYNNYFFSPGANLTVDAAGNLYGTESYFGAETCRCGFVFELSRDASGVWQETILHNFIGGNDGAYPYSAVTFGPDGNLYGTTAGGGSNKYGTVFKLTPHSDGSWGESVIFSFSGTNGSAPVTSPIFDEAGNMYGTTEQGGPKAFACGYGCGLIFELSPNGLGGWTENILYSFQGRSDGSSPSALVRDSAGNLYGTTLQGGNPSKYCYWYYSNKSTCGTVFELTNTAGQWTRSTLYAFNPEKVTGDGGLPMAGLAFDSAGNLYGTTFEGGDLSCDSPYEGTPGCGTVFRLSPGSGGQWSETILHMFDGDDGAAPVAPPIFDASGNLYSTTFYGGAAGYGTVFEITGATSAATNTTIKQRNAARKRTHPLAASPLTKRGAIPLLDRTVAVSAGKEIR
jgi:uncharacterized repeat protein (TIGR03803 family)